MPQTTLVGVIPLKGVSLHSGEDVCMELRPAPANTGLAFHIHAGDGVHILPLHPYAVSTTELATTVSDGTASVSTIEHILAALSGLCVDNVELHVFASEVPILDGSARLVTEAVHKAGICEQKAPRRVARIARPFSMKQENRSIEAEPWNGFHVDYTIIFPHPAIGEQRFALDVTPESFAREIARARTFGFLKEVEYLHSRGLARGGSLENVVVVGEEGVINEGGLRYPDEFVRHKILDFIGDMAMLGKPLRGAFTARCSGHSFNNAFLRTLIARGDALEESVE